MRGESIGVVTISREYGSGGGAFAAALASRLGWSLLDEEIVLRVAERLGIERRTVEALDERPPGLMARFAASFMVTPPEAPIVLGPHELPTADAIAAASRATILEAAKSPPVIIVGHGSQCLLAGRPDALHLRLVAPFADRLRRVCQRRSCGAHDAAVETRRMDDFRARYIQRYHGRDVRDPLLYHLQINTGSIAIGEAADLVVRMIRTPQQVGPSTASVSAPSPG